tara:strand:+ start:608 stop:832 length:225 start_codon:yes stop_codon:yes gene_type:complete
MAITKTQKKELEIIQNRIYEARQDLDAFKDKFILDYMKEDLIQDCMDELEQIENKIDKEFQLLGSPNFLIKKEA